MTPTSLQTLATSVDFNEVEPALYAVAGTLIAVSVILFGIKKVRSLVGNK